MDRANLQEWHPDYVTSAIFIRAVDVTLSKVTWKYVLVYSVNIFIFSKTPEEHIEHTAMLLQVFRDTGIVLKPLKCAFLTNRIDYLGLIICPGWLEVAIHTADIIHGRATSTTATEPGPSLVLCNVFRRLVPNFARIVSFLSRRLQKAQAEDLAFLEEDQLQALYTLKEKLISPLVLTLT